ncbi:hypothetical protein N7457_003562 [Penicillium paradoxum]|uniref:uncharacterized protein n=1 Tax=Penicillium paradoxum TaxID=176176 RepID=UPI0025467981|nr:uncharacterized protein N7457_003562 [Penicillium paradoxum]KAJ5788572.1 hypothetical protein N7457_003562 [Penicillium paradoxum]
MAANCGCVWYEKNSQWPTYLPQVSLKAHATILSSAARTTLTQTFINPSDKVIEEINYQFPLYDGVSVVGFQCKVGSRILHSKVKTKSQANADYKHAVAQKQTAAVMEHTSENDIFLIRLGNVPAREKVDVDITFVGELKQDSQTDGIRYTLPNSIAPRYASLMSYGPAQLASLGVSANRQGMSITVDVQMEKGAVLRELESPSHRIKVSLGRTSSTPANSSTFDSSQASASMVPLANSISVVLEQDFVILIKADGLDTPCALLETHPTIPHQRALMATIVPKFSLQPASPEVVFVIDRSGSMVDKIPTLKSALKVFLKSLPVGVCFNICSFGSYYSFLWPTSKVYDASSLQQALGFADTVGANMGGTEMEQAVVGTVGNRLNHRDLEVLILTDGEIYNQQSLFDFVREKAADNTARFFSLGIGNQASHSLVEGIARAGNGFAQSVMEYEELDRKVVRMLKGALTPHVYDYKLEVEYETQADNEFEILSETEAPGESEPEDEDKNKHGDVAMEHNAGKPLEPISLFDKNFQEPDLKVDTEKRATAKLPTLTPPKAIQAPYKIPSLYPFIRTNVFVLMNPAATGDIPKAMKLTANSKQGPLQLRIPICDIGTGETIHQLASRKAVIELEENHGWLSDAKDKDGNSFKQLHIETQQRLAERECQSLGIKFQVTGKYCSFVALEERSSLTSEQKDKQPASKEHTVEKLSIPQKALKGSGGAPFGRATQFQQSSSSPFGSSSNASFGTIIPPQSLNFGCLALQQSSPSPFGPSSNAPFDANSPAQSLPFGHAAQFQQASPSLFGSSSNASFGANAPAQRQSLSFGHTGQFQQSSPSLFGSSSNASFGANAPAQRQSLSFGHTGQFQQSSPSLFGSSSNASFGANAPAQRQSLSFGHTGQFQQASPSLFGSSSNASSGTNLSARSPPFVPSPTDSSGRGVPCFGNFAQSQAVEDPAPTPHIYASPFRAEPVQQSLGGSPASSPTDPFGPTPPKMGVDEVIRLQNYDGSWSWSNELFASMHTNMNVKQMEVKKLLGNAGRVAGGTFPFGDEAVIIATLLAMGWLQNRNIYSRGRWELVFDKADQWVTHKLEEMREKGVADVDDLTSIREQVLDLM